MAALQREADALATRERGVLDELRRLEVERDLRTEQASQAALALSRIDVELEAMTERLEALGRQAQAQVPDLSGRLVELYKLGNAGYVRLLLSVDDLREMGRAYRFVSALQALDRQRLADHQRTLADLGRGRAALAARRGQHAAVEREMAGARDAAARAADALARLVADIDARRDLNARLVGELQVAHARLQAAMADMARGGRGDAAPVALPLRPFKGDLDWPVPGRPLSRFGRQRHARFHTTLASNGVLISAGPGVPVRAIHEGTIAFAEPFTGFGNLVIIDHGGLGFSMYGHLAEITCRAGTAVTRGQDLGTAGTTIEGTPALYFELRIDAQPVDPLQWLKQR
jgi:septal ring factor EnvC (AmiA/AmiB activator)